MVEHHIKTKDLAAYRILQIIRLALTVEMLEDRLSDTESFDDQVFDLVDHFFTSLLTKLRCDPLEHTWHGALASNVILRFAHVRHEIFAILVNSIVGQVHKQVCEVPGLGTFIGDGCKTGQAFFVEEYTKWVHAR